MTSTTATPVQADHAEIDPRGMRVIWLLLVAAFVAILNETTMGIAIPHLNADLGLSPEVGQWLTSAFMLTMAVTIPTTGFLLQRYTTRQVFLAAMSAFSLGTLICLVSPGFELLLAGRVVQALGTGVMMPLLMTTMMTVVPPHSRGRMMGRVGLVMSLAPAIGPTLSGAILDGLSWRWIFGIVLPIALAALAVGAKWMTNLGETKKAPLDLISVALSALAFGGIVYALSQFGSGHGATGVVSATTIAAALLVGGAIMLGLFVWRQIALIRTGGPLLDLRVFRSRNFTTAVVVLAGIALSMFGTLTLLPQYLQNVADFSALESGLILLPGSVLMGVLAPVIGRVYDASGPRALLIPGTILVSAVLFFYSTLTPSTPVWLLASAQMVMSLGMAMSFTPLFSSSLGSLKRSLYSHGSAVLSTIQQVAGAAGVAVLLAVYSGILHEGEGRGLSVAEAGAPAAQSAFLLAAFISLVPCALTLLIRKPADQDLTPPADA